MFLALGLVAVALLLSSCGGLSPIFPQPVSPNGQDIYDTYIWISYPAIVIFIGVEALLLWVVLRYRRSRQPAGYVPPQIHGHTGADSGADIGGDGGVPVFACFGVVVAVGHRQAAGELRLAVADEELASEPAGGQRLPGR